MLWKRNWALSRQRATAGLRGRWEKGAPEEGQRCVNVIGVQMSSLKENEAHSGGEERTTEPVEDLRGHAGFRCLLSKSDGMQAHAWAWRTSSWVKSSMARTKWANVYKMTYTNPTNAQQISAPPLQNPGCEDPATRSAWLWWWSRPLLVPKQCKRSLCQYTNQY